MSIVSSQYAIEVVGNHRACVDVGTPRFRLQYLRAEKNNSAVNTQCDVDFVFGVERHGSVPNRKTIL